MLAAACGGANGAAPAKGPLPVERLKLPPGFRIEVFARVPNARSMTLGAKGTLFVGNRGGGKVYAVEHDGTRATAVRVLASGLEMPNGVAFRDGSLYVAEISRILRFDRIEERLTDPPKPVVVNDDLPDRRAHGWKFLAFGPDGLLYVPIGAPCNICEIEDPFAAITRMKPDGSGFEIVARGVRNTVGFDWNPATKELWFTDNGRDMLGDDVPPDELNRAPKPGMHFGYPFCHGAGLRDPEYNAGRDCASFTPPVAQIPAHNAALGMRFYRGAMFPAEWKGRVFVAEHGSWNRSTPSGYRVSVFTLDGPRVVRQETFLEGFLAGGEAWGRPVDVQELPDGSLLVSDDAAGAIYRVTYR